MVPNVSISNGAVFNDLEQPLTPILRSHHFLTLNISQTAKNGHSCYMANKKLYKLSNDTIFNDLE